MSAYLIRVPSWTASRKGSVFYHEVIFLNIYERWEHHNKVPPLLRQFVWWFISIKKENCYAKKENKKLKIKKLKQNLNFEKSLKNKFSFSFCDTAWIHTDVLYDSKTPALWMFTLAIRDLYAGYRISNCTTVKYLRSSHD